MEETVDGASLSLICLISFFFLFCSTKFSLRNGIGMKCKKILRNISNLITRIVFVLTKRLLRTPGIKI